MRLVILLLLWLGILLAHPHVNRFGVDFEKQAVTVGTEEYSDEEVLIPENKKEYTIRVTEERVRHQGQERSFSDPGERAFILKQMTLLRLAVENVIAPTIQGLVAEGVGSGDKWSFTFTVWRDGEWKKETIIGADLPKGLLDLLGLWWKYSVDSILWWLGGEGIPVGGIAYAEPGTGTSRRVRRI